MEAAMSRLCTTYVRMYCLTMKRPIPTKRVYLLYENSRIQYCMRTRYRTPHKIYFQKSNVNIGKFSTFIIQIWIMTNDSFLLNWKPYFLKITTWTINTRNTRYIHEPKIKHDTYTKTNLIHEIHTRTIFR